MTGLSTRTVAAIRFGYGPAGRGRAGSAGDLLAGLRGADAAAAAYPGLDLSTAAALGLARSRTTKAARAKAAPDAAKDKAKAAAVALNDAVKGVLTTALSRIADTEDPFRERLAWFWADHFTVRWRSIREKALPGAYVETAIRPNITGRFADLLKAAVTHPAMLIYLDQIVSVGPNSRVGQRRGRGLNENLAREVLELHTLGAGSGYSQTDVRQFAELLTGLGYAPQHGFRFVPGWAEPGAEEVLGQTYGGKGEARLADVHAVLDDLAMRPETARHLSTKLAVHFLSDGPPEHLVEAMTRAYLDSGGDLMVVYAAMLDDPAVWSAEFRKARLPFEFVASGLNALGMTGADIQQMRPKPVQALLILPLARMAQPFMEPLGPDGWPEEPEAWITPQGLAARIAWAAATPRRLDLPRSEPADFAQVALADAASPELTLAVRRAETRADAVALVLASPEFNRR